MRIFAALITQKRLKIKKKTIFCSNATHVSTSCGRLELEQSFKFNENTDTLVLLGQAIKTLIKHQALSNLQKLAVLYFCLCLHSIATTQFSRSLALRNLDLLKEPAFERWSNLWIGCFHWYYNVVLASLNSLVWRMAQAIVLRIDLPCPFLTFLHYLHLISATCCSNRVAYGLFIHFMVCLDRVFYCGVIETFEINKIQIISG